MQYRLRYAFDREFNLKERVRTSIKKSKRAVKKIEDLARAAINRDGESPELQAFLGYSIADLKHHLERQFTRGTSWKAFTEARIHIDHVVPLSSFDVTKPEELKAAWALSNLRPLWEKDNLEKADRREMLL